jgi:hypothetical protein
VQADGTRSTVCDALVGAIDLSPTFLEARGVTPPGHILEGCSLMPWLRGPAPQGWRKAAISEYDYAIQTASPRLGVPLREARLFKVFDRRFKMMHAEGGCWPICKPIRRNRSIWAPILPTKTRGRGSMTGCTHGPVAPRSG